jgi:hypothetical protein
MLYLKPYVGKTVGVSKLNSLKIKKYARKATQKLGIRVELYVDRMNFT